MDTKQGHDRNQQLWLAQQHDYMPALFLHYSENSSPKEREGYRHIMLLFERNSLKILTHLLSFPW